MTITMLVYLFNFQYNSKYITVDYDFDANKS